jgi:hypothetical protein
MLFWFGVFSATFVIGVALLYSGLLYWDVKNTVANAPREEMFVCDKHGVFPRKYALNLGDNFEVQHTDGRVTQEPLLYCTLCYEDRMKEAKLK